MAIMADGSGCSWCGGTEDVAELRGVARCGACRKREAVIEEARRFVGMYGLRPLGGTTASDDEEEEAHRIAARDARRELNEVRLPDADPGRPPAAAAPARGRGGAAANPSRTAPRAGVAGKKPAKAARTRVATGFDPVEVQARVAGLLEELTVVEERLAEAESATGIAASARAKDLGQRRVRILGTLAALEKQRRTL